VGSEKGYHMNIQDDDNAAFLKGLPGQEAGQRLEQRKDPEERR